MAIETNGMLAAGTDPVCLIKETIDDAPYQMFIQKNKKKITFVMSNILCPCSKRQGFDRLLKLEFKAHMLI